MDRPPVDQPLHRAMPHPGPTDSLVDVAGLWVGQFELGVSGEAPDGVTGVTAVVAPAGAVGAVDVRGAAPGSRETDALSVLTSGDAVHAVLLVGRSIFGLAAADGAAVELERRHIGIPVGRGDVQIHIPIVAAAVIFDFYHGDPAIRPDHQSGVAVVTAALDGTRARPRSGNAGVGVGASWGGLVPPRRKGGVGHASLVAALDSGELVVGAVVVVNSSGSAVDQRTGRPWAEVGGFDAPGPVPDFAAIASGRTQTSLAIVGTNARLRKFQLARVAAMAHDGLARAIRPMHTGVDGDAVFALSASSDEQQAIEAHPWPAAAATIVGSLAADAVTRAVLDALRNARSSGGLASLAPVDPGQPDPVHA